MHYGQSAQRIETSPGRGSIAAVAPPRDSITSRLTSTAAMLDAVEEHLRKLEDHLLPRIEKDPGPPVSGIGGIAAVAMDLHNRAQRIAEILARIENALV